jgi:DNA-binding IclR family transcriptional regulator
MVEHARRRASEGERSRYHAPALEKGLDILELLASRPEGLSQAEIARALQRSVGEIFRMLNCLVARGYLAIRRSNDRYVVTLKLFELAHRHPPVERLLGNAAPLMKELAVELRQSCHLALVEGGHALVVAQVDSPDHVGFAVRVGTLLGLPSTSAGRVLLAFQSGEDRAQLLARAVVDSDLGEPAALGRELDAVRSRGHEERACARGRGVLDLSFPVLDQRGSALAALTVPFLERIDLDGFGSPELAREALRRCAARLTSSIGGCVAPAWRDAAPTPDARARRRRRARGSYAPMTAPHGTLGGS